MKEALKAAEIQSISSSSYVLTYTAVVLLSSQWWSAFDFYRLQLLPIIFADQTIRFSGDAPLKSST